LVCNLFWLVYICIRCRSTIRVATPDGALDFFFFWINSF
jgi:hypothetical protein